MIKTDQNGKIIIKRQLLRGTSAWSEWGEWCSSTKEELKEDDTISMTNKMSRISFERVRHSVDQSISLDRKVIRYKTRTVSESIYKDALVKNLTMEIYYEANNTNPNSIYIPIKVCSEGYDKYELCTYIDSGCFVWLGKRALFSECM